MSARGAIQRLCLVTGCALALAAAAGATPAFAAAPWWHLTLGAAPTNLSAGNGSDEVQQLTVSATKGDVLIAKNQENVFASHAVVPYDATARQLQEAMEMVYPSRAVSVAEGTGDTAESHSWTITFPSQSVEPFFVNGVYAASFGGEALAGGKEEATVAELKKGAPAEDKLLITASNLGDADASGASTPMRIAEKLAPGLRAVAVEGFAEGLADAEHIPWSCSLSTLSCSSEGTLAAYGRVEMYVSVIDTGAKTGAVQEAVVSGGGAVSVSASRPVTVGNGPAQFGVEDYEFAAEEEDGALDTQAGSHPFQVTSILSLNHAANLNSPPALPKDLSFKLPPGLVGNPTAYPQCTELNFLLRTSNAKTDRCPADTAIGVATVTIVEPAHFGLAILSVPLFNLVPEVGEPARFGFMAEGTPTILDTSVRTGGDYGVTVTSRNVPETIAFLSDAVTFWGVPGDPRHNNARGWGCVGDERWAHLDSESVTPCSAPATPNSTPFLTMPTSCPANAATGQPQSMQTSVQADSWVQPTPLDTEPVFTAEGMPGMVGCNSLSFAPSISVAPDTQQASTPTGLDVAVRVPQAGSLDGEGLAPADVKDTTVTLPAGVQLSPSAADGLQACSGDPAQTPGSAGNEIGFEGLGELDPSGEPGVKTAQFTPAEASCPEASKVAAVKIKTPLLPNELTGAVYLASPQNFSVLSGAPRENPFESLVAMYLVARDPVSGVLVKLAGRVTPDPVTGQLAATFENTPQLPFDNLALEFFGSDRAPLSTPALCGSYTTIASLTPWSAPESGPPAAPSSSFEITTGPDGSGTAGCSAPRQFAPGFDAQSTNIQAGAFTPFTLTISRPDQDQPLSQIEMTMPPGLAGVLSNVKLCPEPQAAQGTCGPESEIGETTISAGLGNDPYTVTGGKVYITTAYGDGQYGLSIVNPAAAGPFVLQEGRPVIVRAAIFVDPHTAALRIVSASGAGGIPTILDGIPLQIQHVNVTITGAGAHANEFTFNPTNCDRMAVTGTIASSEGAGAAVATPFQVTNCASLKFAPKFTVSTPGKTSKAQGAGLHVKLSYPAGAFGTQANIAKVKVDLPKQLPSQLKTLQKACLAKTFEANPESCPKHSIVGQAKVITPLLPVPLTGNAYFVSHGGEAFPSLTMVLKGYGVTIDLVGSTFIHDGITSSTFKTVPDLPFDTFELTLNQGEYAALNTNLPAKDHGNLCGQKLKMPTAFVAQNGAVIHQNTPIGVSGCPKVKALTRSQKLKAALKACHKKKGSKRSSCERTAHKRYNPLKKKPSHKK